MSSPIHQAKDLDAVLMYAPPWAREQERPEPTGPAGPLTSAPPRSRGSVSVNRDFSGDRAMLALQHQLMHDPDAIPEPPRPTEADQTVRPIALRVCAVAGVAALVAWGMVSVPGTRQVQNETVQASFSPPPISLDRGRREQLRAAAAARISVHEESAAATAPPPPAPSPPPPVTLARTETPAEAQPVAAPPPAPSPPPPVSNTLQLDPDEIAMLLKRGRDFFNDGDLASARLLLRRAAEAGNADAALALGATFDPLVIRRLGAVGAESDTAKAREWYQKAAELGSDAATQRLAKLVESHQ